MLLTLAISGLVLTQLTTLSGLLWLVHRIQSAGQFEALRISALASEAFDRLVAKSLGEVSKANASKQASNIRLSYLADSLAREAQVKQDRQPPDPRPAKTDTGEPIDLNEYEIVA